MPKDMTETRDIFTRRESEARSYCRGMPALFAKARGSELTDANGRTWIDFLAGCSSLNYGHNDPDRSTTSPRTGSRMVSTCTPTPRPPSSAPSRSTSSRRATWTTG